MPRLLTSLVLLLVGLSLPSSVHGLACSTSDDPDYEFKLTPKKGFSVYWNVNTNTMDVKVRYGRDGWVAFGSCDSEGEMESGEVIMGLPHKNTVYKYDIDGYTKKSIDLMSTSSQTLSNTSLSQHGGVTTMTYTKLLVESGERTITPSSSNFMYGYGWGNKLAFHKAAGSFTLNLNTCDVSNVRSIGSQNIYVAHGIMMVIGWCYFIPAGVLAAVFKFILGPVWIKFHKAFEALGFILITVSFFYVLVGGGEEEGEGGDDRRRLDEGGGSGTNAGSDHKTYGITVFVLACVQIIMGLMRPGKSPGPLSEYVGDFDFMTRTQSTARRVFDICHRLLGFFVITLAFVTIMSGLNLGGNEGYINDFTQNALRMAAIVPFAFMFACVVVYRIAGVIYHYQHPSLIADSSDSEKQLENGSGAL